MYWTLGAISSTIWSFLAAISKSKTKIQTSVYLFVALIDYKFCFLNFQIMDICLFHWPFVLYLLPAYLGF